MNRKGVTYQLQNRTLKNIINDSRIPLSKYINKKVVDSDKSMSYFDKLKNRISYGQHEGDSFREFKTTSPQMLARTELSTINTEDFLLNNHFTPIRRIPHQRADSFQIQKNNRTAMSQKKINENLINEIKSDLVRKRVFTTTINSSTLMKAKNKTEVINYSKFTPIPKRGLNELGSEVGEKWGRMELLENLGSGANACVKEGVCQNMHFAVKVYEKYKLLEPRKKKRVYSEIELLKFLPEHPNVITFHEAFEDKRQIHVIFEHLNNSVTLQQYFRNRMLFLEQKERDLIFGKIIRAVHHLHEHGVAHRDIKPDNILICFDDDGEMMVKIIDFGFATQAEQAELHCGTPNFMAPELLDRMKYNPMGVDIWAMGVMFFYLCEGRYPFKGYDEKDLFRSIKHGKFEFKKLSESSIIVLIEEMLRVDPYVRPSTGEIMQSEYVCCH